MHFKCFISNKDCDQIPSKKDNTSNSVFIISPFGFPYDDIAEQAIIPEFKRISYDLKSYSKDKYQFTDWNVVRADQAIQLGYVMCRRICSRIQGSKYVIADISEPNANVFYELGLSYGLGKEILLIANKSEQSYSRKIANMFKEGENAVKVILYRSIADLNAEILRKGLLKNTVSLKKNQCKNAQSSNQYIDHPYIQHFANNNSPVKDFHYKLLEKFFLPNNDLLIDSNLREEIRSSAKEIRNKLSKFINNFNWGIKKPVAYHNNIRINNIVQNNFTKSKICIVDTTHYHDEINPLIYICLGLSHAFQKEVIPFTNAEFHDKFPFDTRGLWHIYYRKTGEYLEQIIPIMEKIFEDFESEKNDHELRELWSPFLEDNVVTVITCARDWYRRKEKRTNVDKCDYKSVTTLTSSLASKFSSEIKFSEPESKETNFHNKKIIEELKNDKGETLKNSGNCIIVGSPDVNDYSEIALAKIVNTTPYIEDDQEKEDLPFIFQVLEDKETIADVNDQHLTAQGINARKWSSFYKEGRKREGVECKGKFYSCYLKEHGDKMKGEAYGVLTIAQPNPDFHQRIMVLSGFTGIATYGMAMLVTNKDGKYSHQLKNLLLEYERECKKQKNLTKSAHILVKVTYEIDELDTTADAREVIDIKVIRPRSDQKI